MTSSHQVFALAQFFDDARLEITGKTILIGQYIGSMVIPPGAPTVDRLVIVMSARWNRDFQPKAVGIVVAIPGQPMLIQPFPFEENPPATIPASEFSSVLLQGLLQIRLSPLRVGDTIDVWLDVDGEKVPAGRLRVVDQPTRTIGVAAI